MARQVRIQYRGALYHVMARGDRREPIVCDDEDRNRFVRTLGEMCARSGIGVHAWALLDNHYHLVLETPEANLVEGMRWLQNSYTRRFNVRHGQWGHLFGGRYKAVLVDPQPGYFGRVLDYVHLNPVRAGLASASEGIECYRWSSLPAYLATPAKRRDWLWTQRARNASATKDTPAGRRAFVERLEKRVVSEGAESAGRVSGENLPGLRLQATIRRGWHFGSQDFRDRMLAFLDGALEGKARPGAERVGDGYHGEQLRDHGERRAREILRAGEEFWEVPLAKLREGKANRREKVMLAELIASETTIRLDWIRGELNMGSRSHCSRLITVRREALRRDPKSRTERDALLKRAKSND